MRPLDLAREHGISTQAVRNYERDGFLPAAERTPAGYRVYTDLHAAALRTFLALVPAHGHAAAGRIMNAVHGGRIDDALAAVDEGHAQLLRDRATLDGVREAVEHLRADPGAAPGTAADTGARTIGELARRLRVTPATLRNWEDAGIVVPSRDPATGTASTAPVTCATPNWPTSCGAGATRWTASPPWSPRSARPAAPTRSPAPWPSGSAG